MQPWSFFKSKGQLAQLERELRKKYKCQPDQCLYTCLQDAPVDGFFDQLDLVEHAWHPTSDGDFIAADLAETGSYELSKRSDFMTILE